MVGLSSASARTPIDALLTATAGGAAAQEGQAGPAVQLPLFPEPPTALSDVNTSADQSALQATEPTDGSTVQLAPEASASAVQGPYGYLEDPPGVGPRKPFTPSQKDKIRAENSRMNGGTLKSDDPEDPYQELVAPSKGRAKPGATIPPNQAQIDHIIPQSLGGSNSYSNARLVSFARNLAKGNKISNGD